ncbi:hypothetical protein [Actinomadura sp. GTD37]|uniref:hypothetical protein n=1 Tax=Actinomadura sp. GTD37 TaxID=1778030 RepID=UPI0035BF03A6
MSALRGFAAVVTGLFRVHAGDRVCVSCGTRTDSVSYGQFLAWCDTRVLPCRCGGQLETPQGVAS